MVESRSTGMVSRMTPRDARRLIRAAAARGLDGEVVEPPLLDMDWGPVILKPLSGDDGRI